MASKRKNKKNGKKNRGMSYIREELMRSISASSCIYLNQNKKAGYPCNLV